MENIWKIRWEDNNNFKNIQQQTQEVICRIFFVRHGKTDFEGKSPQLSDTQLSEEWKNEMHAVAKRLKRLWANKQNTLLLCRPGEKNEMKRIVESKEILEQYDIGTYESEILLDTTEKIEKIDPETWEKQIKSSKEHHNASWDKYSEAGILMEKIRTQEQYSKYKHIILLGHKSNDALLEILQWKKEKDETTLNPWRVKTWVIYEGDIKEDKEYANYEKQKEKLYIHNKNITGMVNILRQEEWLRGYIESFFKKELKIFELQNSINAYFTQNPKFYEKYLASENVDLRVFCLANLIRLEKYTVLLEVYMQNTHTLSEDEKDILLKHHSIAEIKEIITKHFVDKRTLRKKEESELFKKHWLDNYYNELKDKCKIDEKVKSIQEKSLDEKVKKHCEWGVLQRELSQIIEKKDTKENIMYELKKIDIKTIVQWLKDKKKYVLPAHVGSGKSIWISDFVKNIHYTHKVIFYEWSEIRNLEQRETIKEKITENTILCIDAIDEINIDQVKQKIKQDIVWLWCGIMVTGRLSEYNDKKNDGFETLEMKWIDKEKFITSRVEESKRNAVKKTLEHSNLAWEIEWNPLLLNFVCMLANDYEKFQWLGIQKLEDIKNKGDLYENVVKLILCKHQSAKINNNPYSWNSEEIQEKLKKDLNTLAKFSYFLYQYKDDENFKDKFQEFKSNNWITNTDFNHLNILFKVNEDSKYWFIHKSFEEFFLMKYMEKNKDLLEKEINQESMFNIACDFCNFEMIKAVWEKSNNNIMDEEKPYFISGKWFNINNQIYHDHMFLAKNILNTNLIKFLVINYIDNINELNLWYQLSLLDYSILYKNIELIGFLIENWSDVFWYENMRRSPFERACGCMSFEWIQHILNIIDNQMSFVHIQSWFNSACLYWNFEVMKKLFNKYSKDISIHEWFLEFCSSSKDESIINHKKIVDFFIEWWLDINKANSEWDTWIVLASKYWNKKIVSYLIEKWVHINDNVRFFLIDELLKK